MKTFVTNRLNNWFYVHIVSYDFHREFLTTTPRKKSCRQIVVSEQLLTYNLFFLNNTHSKYSIHEISDLKVSLQLKIHNTACDALILKIVNF